MRVGISFDEAVALLQRHLPRPVPGGPVQITSDRLSVTGDGVSLRDIGRFLTDLGRDGPGFLPKGLGLDDIRLDALELERVEATGDLSLDFTLSWTPHTLPVAGPVSFEMASLRFTWETGGRLHAYWEIDLSIDGHVVAATLDLPEQMIGVTLLPVTEGSDHDAAHADATALLEAQGLAQGGVGLSVSALSFSASIPFRHAFLHLELDNLFSIGPVHVVHARGDLEISQGEASAALAADIRIDVTGHPAIEIAAEAEADRHGWRVAGSIDLPAHTATIGELITSAGGRVHDVPNLISDLALRRIAAAIDTHSNSYRLDVGLEWDADADLIVHLEKTAAGLDLSGTLHLHGLAFKLEFQHGIATFIAASFMTDGGRKLGLQDLLAAAGVPDNGVIGPSGIHMDVSGLSVIIGPQKRALIAAAVQSGIDLRRLGDLPVLGALLPKGARLGLTLDPYFLSSGMTDQEKSDAAALLPAALKVPDTLEDGVHIAARLELGGDPITIDGPSLGAVPDATPHTATAPAAQPQTESGLTWVDVNKSLGPLHLSRAGYNLDMTVKAVDLALDAEISVAGLTLSLDGLGARYEVPGKRLTPHLAGAALDIKRGALEIGAAFLNNDGDFEGALDIGLETFAIHAIGAFTMIDDAPSIFAFGTLDMPLGGPVFFFVEGLAAGVGVHRSLHMPRIEDLHRFPMITAAAGAAAGAAAPTDVNQQLRALHHYVAPRLGDYFLAAGIKFNSFRLLHGQLVLIVQFGHALEIDVVGTASYSTPPDLPRNVPALARVDLDLIARFVPAKGELKVDARLDPRSYVYSPLCHLSGSFAFYSWMTGVRAGDFVLSVGGYFPGWKPPAHYPRVPRVTLKYMVSSEVYLKGTGYFAMTPSVAMAGGALHAQINIGSLHAWADFSADFLVGWEPFHYQAAIHIGIGARWKCFHTHASADLRIWGPDFSGTASVDWWIFSFDVHFGKLSSPYTPPISFERFRLAFLGIGSGAKSANEKLGITVSRGSAGKIDDFEVVAPAGLEFSVSTPVPLEAALVGAKSAKDMVKPVLGMPPMGGKKLGESKMTVTVRHKGSDISAQFEANAVSSGVPAALWLASAKVSRDEPPITATTGLRVHHARRPAVGSSVTRKVGKFQYPTPAVTRPLHLWARSDTPSGPIPDMPPMDDLAALGLGEDMFWSAPALSGQES